MGALRFDPEDLSESLPAPGWYPTRIGSSRWRESAAGNRMLQVVYVIEGAGAVYARLAEYFVLDEQAASAVAVALARRRLASLYRAAGLSPEAGDSISASDLVDGRLEIAIEPELWQGRTRFRVVGHRPLVARASDHEPTSVAPPSGLRAS